MKKMKLLLKKGLVAVNPLIVLFYIRQALSKTKEVSPQLKKPQNTINFLALSSNRFMEDLEILSADEKFRVYTLSPVYQGRILSLYQEIEDREILHNFLKKFLKIYFKKIRIDCVLSPTFWYSYDIPWGKAAESLGIPYVAFHKESYKPEKPQQETTALRAKRQGPFVGSHLIVHNQHIKDLLIREGFVEKNKISSLGCMRMDRLVNAIKNGVPKVDRKKQVTLFSFAHYIGLDDYFIETTVLEANPFLGWIRLFEQTHVAFVRAAQRCPEATFIIKPKKERTAYLRIEQALKISKINTNEIPNLIIDYNLSSYDCIINSDVVCTFQSMTNLEAAILGKPVIVPHFEEALRPMYQDHLKLFTHYDIFDVARSPEEFEELIIKRLNDNYISDEIMEKRRALFSEWISDLEGQATEKYKSLLQTVVNNKKREALC